MTKASISPHFGEYNCEFLLPFPIQRTRSVKRSKYSIIISIVIVTTITYFFIGESPDLVDALNIVVCFALVL